MDTQVLVVGAGPVGLTLALDLGRRGVSCVLAEKKEAPQFLPKMERCNARTMEIYRRMGLVEEIRAAGLDAEMPMDVFIVLDLARPPLLRLPYSSVAAARDEIAACTDGTMPLEPYQLVSQYTLEPLLKAAADRLPAVDVRFGHELEDFTQDDGGVTATLRRVDGTAETVNARYMVGCDGGSSTVRRQLGIQLRGDADLMRFVQGLFRCDGLFDQIPIADGPGHGRHYHVADAEATFLIMQDSKRHWTLHASVTGESELKRKFEETITLPLDYEMLYCGEWQHNLMLADAYRRGRIFLAGDAVHLMIPTGGLGMNSGVGDAVDLSWKIAATLQGWGGPALLDSYEVERRQVGDRNVGASRYASTGRRKWRSQYKPGIDADTGEGAALRDNLIRVADVEQRKSNEMIGAELGYRYVGSPLIWEEPGGPEHLFREYVPTSWPGARLPHVWLDGGTAIQDVIPEGYALIRFNRDDDGDGDALAKAFADLGAPFSVVDVAGEAARAVYGFDYLLVRPDLHVVWRGNRMHDAPRHLAGVATGHQHITDN